MPEEDEAADGENEEERRVGEALEGDARKDGIERRHGADAHEDDADTLDKVTVYGLSDCLGFRCFPGEARCEDEAENEEEEEDAKEHGEESHGVNKVEWGVHKQNGR